jgi:hypothetical protein
MRTQLENQAAAISDSSTKHDDTEHILMSLLEKLQVLEKTASSRPPPEEAEPGPSAGLAAGRSVI